MKGKTNAHKSNKYSPPVEAVTINVTGPSEDFKISINKLNLIIVPTGYTHLEYIESTKTQYINTGFKPTYQTRVVMTISDIGSSVGFLFGTRDTASNTSSKQFGVYRTSSGIRSDYFGTYKSITPLDFISKGVVDKNANVLNFKETSVTNTSVSSGTCTYPLTLFALNNAGTINSSLYLVYKLYSCLIYDNGKLIRDYIPMLNEEGVAGLYDCVNKVFYKSNSSTDFVAGPEVSYTELEYLETTGTQYVDTGIFPDLDTKVEIKFQSTATTGSCAICGETAWRSTTFGIWTHACGYGSTGTTGLVMYGDAPITAILDKNILTKNGNTLWTTTEQTFTSPYSMYLGGGNKANRLIEGFKGKIYSCKIYKNNILLKDYIPVMSSNGTVGFYDRLNETFSASFSSDAFVAGTLAKEVITTQTTVTATHNIPYDTVYIILAENVLGYTSPLEQIFVANQITRTVNMNYEELPVGVYIMDLQGNLHSTNSWTGGSDATGVAVITDKTSFIVAPDEWYTYNSDSDGAWNGNTRSAWGGSGTTVTGIKTTESWSTAITDFAGSANTDAIISQLKGKTDDYSQYYTGAPAAEYCKAYSKGCKDAGLWYLPSAGEMNQIILNRTEIEVALTAISGELFDIIEHYLSWTSTQFNDVAAWCYLWLYKLEGHYNKNNYIGVRPICK